MQFGTEDDEFRRRVADWLAANVPAELRDAGGAGREHEAFAERLAWNRRLAAAGWTCLGWPAAHGGRDATLRQQMIFYEEYARSRAPARVTVVGEELLGPTLIAFGTAEQQRRFLPPIAAVEELWCQGYSEPAAARPGGGVQHRGARGRRVGDHRPEGVDVARARGRLVLRPGQDRTGLAPFPWPVLPARAHASAGDHGPADQAADGGVGVQRGLLRRGADRARPRGRRARRRLADREGDAGVRARGRACSGSRSGSGANSTSWSSSRGGPRRGRTRSCATGSPGPGSASRSSGRTRSTPSASLHRGRNRGRGLGAEGALVAVASGARGAGDGRARRRVDGGRRRRRRRRRGPGRVAAAVPVRPGHTMILGAGTRSSGTSSPPVRWACRGRCAGEAANGRTTCSTARSS